ncbi:molybdate ABC transporter permease subunit, partial [Aduncisulcus paluster]
MVLPPTVLGFGLLIVMGPQGPLGGFWKDLTGERMVFSFSGILLASLVYNLPFAVQPMLLPNSLPGLAASAMLVFAHSLGEFGVILMVGGSIPGSTKVASIAIYEAVEAMRYGDAMYMSLAIIP